MRVLLDHATTHPSVSHEQLIYFHPSEVHSAWPYPGFWNSSAASTSLHHHSPTNSPASSARKGTKTVFQSFKTKTSYGSSSTWIMYVSISRFTRSLLSQRRFSKLSILPVLHSGNAYVSSEGYAAPGKGSHSHICSKALFRSSVNARSPLEVPVISMKGRWATQPFASRDYGFTPKNIRGGLSRYIIGPITFSSSHR